MHNFLPATNHTKKIFLELVTRQIQKTRLLGFRLAVLPYNITVALAAGAVLFFGFTPTGPKDNSRSGSQLDHDNKPAGLSHLEAKHFRSPQESPGEPG